MNNKIKKFLIIAISLFTALTCLFMFACNENQGKEEEDVGGKITLNETAVSLNVGDTFTIVATTDLEGDIEYVSMDENIATVDETGVVTAVSDGKVSVYVLVGNYGSALEVTVRENLVYEYSISFVKDAYTLMAGDKYTIKPIVKYGPDVVTGIDLTYSSSNEEAATVASNGEITAKAKGNTLIGVSLTQNGKTVTNSVPLLVVRNLEFVLSKDNIEMTLSSASETVGVEVYENQEKIVDPVFTWSSSDERVATVDATTGEISPVGQGTATISACYDSVYAECEVTVYTAMISNADEFSLIYSDLGGFYKITNDITVNPSVAAAVYNHVVGGLTDVDYSKLAEFNGTIDGGNNTITVTGSRMFYETKGATFKNMNVNANLDFYSVGVFAYKSYGDTFTNVKVNATATSSNGYRITYWDSYPIGVYALKAERTKFTDCVSFLTIDKSCVLNHPSGPQQFFQINTMSAFCAVDGAAPEFLRCSAYCINNASEESICFMAGSSLPLTVNMLKPSTTLTVGGTYQMTSGEDFYSSDNKVATVTKDGLITAVGGGVANISYISDGYELVFRVIVQKTINTVEDFKYIYNSAATLSGNYILGANITITPEDLPTGLNSDYNTSASGYVFSGILDGDNHTITFVGGRIFSYMSTATVRNITFNYTQSGDFGGLFGNIPSGVRIENSTFNITFTNARNICNNQGWDCTAGGLFSMRNAGTINITECTFNVIVSETMQYDSLDGINAFYKVSNISAICVCQAWAGDGLTYSDCTFTLVNNYSGTFKDDDCICEAAAMGNAQDGSHEPTARGNLIHPTK